MRIAIWHVHGSWLTAFVQGRHDYLVPVLPDRGPDGRGRARTWDWPRSVSEVTPAECADLDVDAVVLQRPHEQDLVRRWFGREPGRDLPAVYVEHDAPAPSPVTSRHHLADRADIPLVHVTHFNRLCWDSGRAPTSVIEHGVVDPGARWTGELGRAAAVLNEPVRRGRTVGTDLLPLLARAAPLDLFGAADGPVGGVTLHGDVPQDRMHGELARRRVYVHTPRWTSLGLSLLEAMTLGMPVVAVAATEVPRAVPAAAGVVSADPEVLARGIREFIADPALAAAAGAAGRAHALHHYGVSRFLDDWDRLLAGLGAATDHPIPDTREVRRCASP